MPHLANKFDVRRVLHGQVSLAAVNLIYVIHEAMKGCNNKMDSAFQLNIKIYCTQYEGSTIVHDLPPTLSKNV